MKITGTLLVVLLLFLIGCTTKQEKEEVNNDLAEMNLKGGVKMLKEISYKVADNFGETKKAEPFRERGNDFIIMFNNDGKRMLKSHYRGHVLLEKEEFIYNEAGLLIKEVSYGNDGKKESEIKYKYDENGFLIEDFYFKDFDIDPCNSPLKHRIKL